MFRHFWWLLGLAWLARVGVALSGDFVFHPDEVTQYLGWAHTIAFDAGLLPPEQILGYRNPLIPYFLAGGLLFLDLVGLGTPSHYVPGIEILLCTLSLSLPVSMYFIMRNMYGERPAVIAFLFGCFWYEFVVFAHRPLSDTIVCYVAFMGFAFASLRKRTVTGLVACAILFAVAVAIRYQIALLVAPLAALVLTGLDRRRALIFVGAGIVTLVLAGLPDYLVWKEGLFSSLVNHFIFNYEHDSKYDTDYEAPIASYVLWYGIASLGFAWLAIALAAIRPRRYFLFLSLLALFVIPHSMLIHKLYRVSFPWIPLYLMIGACWISLAIGPAKARVSGRSQKLGFAFALVFGVIGLFGTANRLPYQDDLYNPYLGVGSTYRPPRFLEFDPLIKAYMSLARDESVLGLLDYHAKWWFQSPGYYYFHHQAPIYFFQGYGMSFLMREGVSELVPNRFFTHILAPPDMHFAAKHVFRDGQLVPVQSETTFDDLYDVIEKTEDYWLWRVKPKHRVAVPRFQSYRFTPYYVSARDIRWFSENIHMFEEHAPRLKRD